MDSPIEVDSEALCELWIFEWVNSLKYTTDTCKRLIKLENFTSSCQTWSTEAE